MTNKEGGLRDPYLVPSLFIFLAPLGTWLVFNLRVGFVMSFDFYFIIKLNQKTMNYLICYTPYFIIHIML